MRTLIVLACVAGLLGGFYLWSNFARDAQRRQDASDKNQVVQDLVSSEELLLHLTPKLKPLSRSVMNLQLPDPMATELFANQIALSGEIAINANPADTLSKGPASPYSIDATSQTVNRAELNLWRSLLEQTSHFDHAKFYFVRGNLVPGERNRFSSAVGFDALANGKDQKKISVHAELEIEWARESEDSDKHDWKITSWKLIDVRTMESQDLIFRNVLDEVIDDPRLLVRSTASRHAQLTSHLIAGKEYIFPPGETYPLFFPDVTLEHPGIAVVDIDGDGFDDLYVAMQHDENLLFRNKGDGSFEEVAARYGLNILGDSTSAIFADFDNDGDPDLFLGRARRRSKYFVNQNGTFVDKTDQSIAGGLPALVSSISAADYNNDGLLDVYLCTYSPIEESNRFQVANKPMWADLFLTPEQAQEVSRRNGRSHRFLDRAGPPNLLLQNTGGGKFVIAPENPQLELWRMSFQAAWNDFDHDGDQDIYVSNDYGPDNFFRNDGSNGFKDITTESGLTEMGFGMGVSFGDYDNDGREDVYVTNMYSKAGLRITDQVEDLDPRIREMAQGNFLYRSEGDKFSLVSGSKETDLHVAKSGWSWGGQFLDFDNDGFRDIYATSGYYTAPADVAIDLDL